MGPTPDRRHTLYIAPYICIFISLRGTATRESISLIVMEQNLFTDLNLWPVGGHPWSMVIPPPLQVVLLVDGHQRLVELIVYCFHTDKSIACVGTDFHKEYAGYIYRERMHFHMSYVLQGKSGFIMQQRLTRAGY